MKIHRFYIHDLPLYYEVGHTIDLNEEGVAHQIHHVLHLQLGEIIEIFSQAICYQAEIVEIDKSKNGINIKLKINNKYSGGKKGNLYRNIYVSAIKKSNFELILEKSVELGIDKVILHRSARAQMSNYLALQSESFQNRANRIIVEATEQSGRYDVMKYELESKSNMSQPNSKVWNIYASLGAQLGIYEISRDIIREAQADQSVSHNINIYIGPEGGWTEVEEAAMLAEGYIPARLGEHVLRAETAAIVAAASIQ